MSTNDGGEMQTEKKPFEAWAIVEIFGHHQIAGYVSEQAIGGASFVRVDVPAGNGFEAYSKLYGGAAIFAIHPCTEAVAKQAAASLGRQGALLPVYVPDLSAAKDTIAEARRAADWLREQQAQIAAVLRQTAERENARLLAASEERPWERTRDFDVGVAGDLGDEDDDDYDSRS